MSLTRQDDLVFHTPWPGNTTPAAVDGTGGTSRTLVGWSLLNTAAAARFVKFYDLAIAPTIGTTVPKLVIGLAATSGREICLPRGILFTAGLWVSVTNVMADNDNTAPTANDVLVNAFYQ